MTILLTVLFIIVCVLLIGVVLLQKGRGGGLGAALGGGAGSAFGTRTGDVFTWVTIVLAGLFLLMTIGMTLAFRPEPTKLPAPVFLPPAGEIATAEFVAVRVENDRGNVEIYYTLDGSDPTRGKGTSMKYRRQAVKVEPGTTLKARAFSDTRDPSPIANAVYPKLEMIDPDELPETPREEPEPTPETGPADDQAGPAETAPATAPAETPATAPAS